MPVIAEGIIIIGAGDHGRGTFEILHAERQARSLPAVVGFLDDSPARQGAAVDGVPVLGGLEWVATHHRPELRYIIGIADCRVKKEIASKLEAFGVKYESAVHPSATVGRGVRVLPGAIINAGVTIAYDTLIASHTTTNLNATIGHDCVVGPYSTIAPGANVAGRVVIGEGCDISLNAAVCKGLSIGDWASVGPGAVVVRDVPPRARVFGNPARVIDRVSSPESLPMRLT